MRLLLLFCFLLLGLAVPAFCDSHPPVPSDDADRAAVDDSVLADRIHHFITDMSFSHGVPYRMAHGFGPRGLPILFRMLDDEQYRDRWVWVVTTMGWIGDRRAFPMLRHFLLARFRGEVDQATFQALMAAPDAIGALHDREGTEFLVDHVDPDAWGSIQWTVESERGNNQHIPMSIMAINGLSYTGTRRAASVLAELKKKPYSINQVPNIEEGIRRNAEIASKGWEGYLKGMKNY
jgi:hypothetical protein